MFFPYCRKSFSGHRPCPRKSTGVRHAKATRPSATFTKMQRDRKTASPHMVLCFAGCRNGACPGCFVCSLEKRQAESGRRSATAGIRSGNCRKATGDIQLVGGSRRGSLQNLYEEYIGYSRDWGQTGLGYARMGVAASQGWIRPNAEAGSNLLGRLVSEEAEGGGAVRSFHLRSAIAWQSRRAR